MSTFKKYLRIYLSTFTGEHYEYLMPKPLPDSIVRVESLLKSKGVFKDPNLSGSVSGNKFEASPKFSFAYIKGGGPAAHITGNLEAIDAQSTRIHLYTHSHVSFVIITILSPLFLGVLLYLYFFSIDEPITGSILNGAILSIGLMSFLSFISWYAPYNMRHGLRQTFEVNLGINPLPENHAL